MRTESLSRNKDHKKDPIDVMTKNQTQTLEIKRNGGGAELNITYFLF